MKGRGVIPWCFVHNAPVSGQLILRTASGTMHPALTIWVWPLGCIFVALMYLLVAKFSRRMAMSFNSDRGLVAWRRGKADGGFDGR